MTDAQTTSPSVPTRAQLAALYGHDSAVLEAQEARYAALAKRFARHFPESGPLSFFSSPGRTEIIGNHTDHQNGKVMCAAVALDIVCAAAKNDDFVIRLISKGFDKIDIVDLRQLEVQEEEREHSASLLRGIAARFAQLGLAIGGFDAYTESNVMTGSGLSSSAAFEILVATLLDHLYNGDRLSGLERAQVSQYAENVYFGKPSGLMDQCGCGIGGFIYIDFKKKEKPQIRRVQSDFDAAGYAMVITHPGGSHADLTDAYAAIPAEMKAVASALGVGLLSERSEEDFYAALPRLHAELPDRALLRAFHFYDEQKRVEKAFASLEGGDYATFFACLKDSGLSSWMQLQNVCPPSSAAGQPLCLALAYSEKILAGRGICRVHGGGFAGTIQAFMPLSLAEDYVEKMNAVFGEGSAQPLGLRAYGGIALEQLG